LKTYKISGRFSIDHPSWPGTEAVTFCRWLTELTLCWRGARTVCFVISLHRPRVFGGPTFGLGGFFRQIASIICPQNLGLGRRLEIVHLDNQRNAVERNLRIQITLNCCDNRQEGKHSLKPASKTQMSDTTKALKMN
jgi:hypothetical protein